MISNSFWLELKFTLKRRERLLTAHGNILSLAYSFQLRWVLWELKAILFELLSDLCEIRHWQFEAASWRTWPCFKGTHVIVTPSSNLFRITRLSGNRGQAKHSQWSLLEKVQVLLFLRFLLLGANWICERVDAQLPSISAGLTAVLLEQVPGSFPEI